MKRFDNEAYKLVLDAINRVNFMDSRLGVHFMHMLVALDGTEEELELLHKHICEAEAAFGFYGESSPTYQDYPQHSQMS